MRPGTAGSGGFQAAITISNQGATAINGWTLRWSFANGQVISQLWNGSPTQSGAGVSVTNLSYNATIAAGGGTADMGFLSSWNNLANAKPTSFTLNNTACAIV